MCWKGEYFCSDNFGAAASLVPDDYYEFYDTSSYYRDQPATDKINSDKLDNISDYEDSNEHKKSSKATSEHRTRHGKEESYDREKHKERLASELARLIQINNEIKKEQESKGKTFLRKKN